MIPTRTLVSLCPARHTRCFRHSICPSPRRPLIANGSLEVQGSDSVWALGDCAQIPTKDGGFAPPTAQHAIRQAKTAAHNIVAAIRGGSKTEFAFGGLGKMGALGHHSAVAEIMGINISGFSGVVDMADDLLNEVPGWGRRLK